MARCRRPPVRAGVGEGNRSRHAIVLVSMNLVARPPGLLGAGRLEDKLYRWHRANRLSLASGAVLDRGRGLGLLIPRQRSPGGKAAFHGPQHRVSVCMGNNDCRSAESGTGARQADLPLGHACGAVLMSLSLVDRLGAMARGGFMNASNLDLFFGGNQARLLNIEG